MSVIDKTLLPDEKIIFRTRKHLIIFLTPLLWVLMAIACLFTPNDIVVKFAAVPGIVAIVTGINQWLQYIVAEFVVTNQRIIMREGFFFRHINELRLATVSNMSVNQSLAGQMLGYGTIIISPFGGHEDLFTDISQPLEFQSQSQAQINRVT